MKNVIVIGGGLAGMAAAVALESAGASVILLESRRALGGRASSFEEPKTGEELDNCQHVLLGCCTNLIDLYRRLGVEHLIRFERTVYFRDGLGERHDLWGVEGWPAPLHLGPSMAGFEALTLGERMSISLAMLAMSRLGRAGRDALDDVSFGAWLDEHRQSPSLVHKFYDPILISALNEESRRASAKYAIQVFQDAMLANEAGYLVGLPDCPLGQLYANLPCRDVRLGTRVNALRFDGHRVTGVELQDGTTIDCDAAVLSTNHHAVSRWISPEVAKLDSRFASLDRLESVPILGAHLWFDRPIMRESHAALIDGPLQWLFRKDTEGRILHGVISAAREWVDVPKQECLDQFQQQVRSLFPAARSAKLIRGVIVVEKRATFSPLPGADRYRPNQAPPTGGIENLYLAGDYTKTDWPATMEGAVRSGYLAAKALAAQMLHQNTRFVVPDLPLQWPAKLLARRA
jgi:squalene-associated FAD-dependent desaturase